MTKNISWFEVLNCYVFLSKKCGNVNVSKVGAFFASLDIYFFKAYIGVSLIEVYSERSLYPWRHWGPSWDDSHEWLCVIIMGLPAIEDILDIFEDKS